MPTVDIDGFGRVQFPDSMSPAQIDSAIRNQIMRSPEYVAARMKQIDAKYAPLTQQPKQPVQQGSSAGRFLDAAVGDTARGLYGLVAHPLDTGAAIGNAAIEQGRQAAASFNQGDYLSAAGHGLAAALPGIGPAAAQAGEEIGSGNIAAGLGHATALLAPTAAKAGAELLPKNATTVTARLPTTLTPQRSAAVAWAMQHGIPLDAASQTGNSLIRSAQELAQTTPGASSSATKAIAARNSAFATAGRGLAAKAARMDLSPEQAGNSVVDAARASATKFSAEARSAYKDLAAVDNDPANVKTVQVGTKTQTSGVLGPNGQPIVAQVPITKDIAVPADLTAFKQALTPLAKELQNQVKLGQERSAPALAAVNEILSGDNVIPAAQAEKNLGALKQVLRKNATGPAQFLASKAIGELDNAVQDAYSQTGDNAFSKLQEARLATANKYDALGLIKQFRQEPVKLFQQIVQPRDQSIGLLRQIQTHAPAELPKVGRAYLEGMLDSATESGGFEHTDRMYSNWQKLGDEQKKLMYPNPMLRRELNNFFQAAKDSAKVENPSGTAKVSHLASSGALVITSPHIGIPYIIAGNALSRLLYNPKFVRAATQGFQISIADKAASSIAAGRMLNAAGADAQPAR